MVSQILSSLPRSSSRHSLSHLLSKDYNNAGLSRFSPGFASRRLFPVNRSECKRTTRVFNSEKGSGGEQKVHDFSSSCLFNSEKGSGGEQKGGSSQWRVLQRWEVPWGWQTFSLTSIACGLSLALTGMAFEPFFRIGVEKLSLDQKAGLLLLDDSLSSAAVLAVIFAVAKTYMPLPRDIFRFDLKQPFNLRKGWLLWGGIGLVGNYAALALTSCFFRPDGELGALKEFLPFIGHSNISTLSLVGLVGILGPLFEETMFRGFFMVSLTKWVPTPIAIIISSAAFALVHCTPILFPQLFVGGLVFGLSYAQTRNLMTPMIIHGFWNTGVLLVLTYLKIKGVDIKELLLTGKF